MEMSFPPSDKEKSGVNPEKAVGHRHSHSLLAKGWIATFYGKVIGKYLFKMRNEGNTFSWLTLFLCVYVCMYAWEVFREELVICYVIKSKQNTRYGLLHFPWSWLVSYRTFSISSLYAAWKLIWYSGLKTNVKCIFVKILHLLKHCWNHFGRKQTKKNSLQQKRHLQSYL